MDETSSSRKRCGRKASPTTGSGGADGRRNRGLGRSAAPLARGRTSMRGVQLDRRDIEERVRALGDWFHNLDLAGVRTAPDHFLGDYPRDFWRCIENTIPWDLRGKTVLDVGCNAGFFSIEMKRRGADRVLGIDSDERY